MKWGFGQNEKGIWRSSQQMVELPRCTYAKRVADVSLSTCCLEVIVLLPHFVE
jgi:hypothetical protein